MQEKDNNNPGMYLFAQKSPRYFALDFQPYFFGSNFAFAAGAFASQLFILV